MKKILPALILLLLLFNASMAQHVYRDYVDGVVYIKFTSVALKAVAKEDPKNIPLGKLNSIKHLVARYGITKAYKPFYQASDDQVLPYILKLEFSQTQQVESLISDLIKIQGVEYAEKINLNKTHLVPNDPMFATASGSTHLNQINAQNAWNVFSGSSNITVAIIDNAVMSTHADLSGNIYSNTLEASGTANVDDDGNGYVDDINGYDVAGMDGVTNPTNTLQDHGTHCAGIAGASTGNSTGIASIGWGLKIIPVKASFDNSPTTSVDMGYEGIIYAVKAKAKIISCSWGSSGGSSFTEQAVIDYAWNRGCIVFASAGNLSSSTQNYPGAYNHVYCVAAVNGSNVKSSYSNYGSWVDISAPGDNILSTVPYSSTPAYVNFSGTSMATPLVAGLAGLMLSKSPNMTRTDVLNCLSTTAVNIYTIGGNASYVSGSQLGAGRIDAFAAMNCAATYSALPPVANFYAFLPNTCPNTLIPFVDSSLYAPTSWSWVFQGGTPATSTLSNPSVQWSTAGTYSVSLTVSNASGNNTKTKLSYVTVAGPSALPFSEGFQASTFLPPNWVANNLWNDNIYWERVTGVGGFGTSTACAVFNNYVFNAPGERDEMRTPKFNFNNVATARLRFDVAYARYNASFSDTLVVKASTNCGSSWSSIYAKGGTTLSTVSSDQTSFFNPTSTQWRRDSIDVSIPTAGQGNVMFSFLNHGHYGQPIYLDNINLVFPTPSLSANNPASACASAPITFTNTSLSTGSYTWNFPGGSPATSNASNASVSYATPGTYTISLIGANGTSTAAITKTLSVVANPTVASTSGTFCSGKSYTINASGASSYTWNASTGVVGTASSLVINPLASSVYTITGISGICSAQGLYSVNVTPSPTVSATNQTICIGSNAVITASGATSYSWNTGAATSSISVTPVITTIYTVTGTSSGCSTTKTVSINVAPQLTLGISASPSVVCPNGSSTLTATGAASYSWNASAGATSLVVNPGSTTNYTLTASNGVCTASALATLTVVPLPVLTINTTPSGTICAGAQVMLSATGANSYSWSSGATSPSVQVSPSVSTIYTVTGTNTGCSNTQTVSVTVGTSSISVAINASTLSGCAGMSSTLTPSGASSYTWSSGAGSGSIVVSPSVTTVYTLTGANGACVGKATTTISIIPAPVSVLSTSNSSCASPCNGIVNATSSGGSGPYTYSLSSNTCNSLPCTNLCPGLYTLHTTNGGGCSSTNLFSISSLASIQSVISVTNSGCAGCANGAIAVNASGGTGPYTYIWLPSGGNAATASDLLPGCYTVSISDANGCNSSTLACISIGTGVSSISNSNVLLIYPNPAEKEVNISYTGVEFNYTVYNNLGQLIVNKTNNQELVKIDLSAFAKGIYLIEVETGKDKVRKKLIVE